MAHRYRWVILAVFALANIVIEIQWVALAPVTSEAAGYYAVDPLAIGFLSMLFMLVYLVMAMPASWVIDRLGLRVGVGIGVALTGVCGLLKGLFASDYDWVFASQIGLAVAQPFILNAYTKLSGQWFPPGERATATGISSLAQYVGIILAMATAPALVQSMGVPGTLLAYGIVSAVAALLFFVFFRERPPASPTTEAEEPKLAFGAGLKHMLKQRDMVLLLVLFFVGLGIFNALTTWIEQVVAPRGFDAEDAGLLGALMMVGGVIGAVVLPLISDKMRARKPILALCMVMVVPGLAGVAFAPTLPLLLASGFVLGFFIMSAGPIGFQYAAEVSAPAPEASSQGLILLSGQISGIAFIFGMDAWRGTDGSMAPSMMAFTVLAILAAGAVFLLHEKRPQ